MAAQRFTVGNVVTAFLRSLTQGTAAAAIDVPTNSEMATAIDTKAVRYDAAQSKTSDQKQQARVNTFSMQDLRAGRTLGANTTIALADYGTFVSLASYTLSPGTVRAGGVLGVQGPGTVETEEYDPVVLVEGDNALVLCLADGDTRVTAVSRKVLSRVWPASTTAPEGASNNDTWTDSETLRSYIYYDGFWVEETGIPTVPVFPCRTIATATGSVVSADLNGYIRATYDAVDDVTKILTIPAPGGAFAPIEGGLYTVRNAGDGDLTLVGASVAVVLNYDTGADVIPQNTTGQLYCVSVSDTTFEFDIL